MNRSLLRDYGWLGVALGIAFLLGALFAYYYEGPAAGISGVLVYTPYREFSGILLVAGIVSLMIGLGFLCKSKHDRA